MIIQTAHVLGAALYASQAKDIDPLWSRLPEHVRDQWCRLASAIRGFVGPGNLDRIDRKHLAAQFAGTSDGLFPADQAPVVARAFLHLLPVVTDDAF
jgi:hypothetical protein